MQNSMFDQSPDWTMPLDARPAGDKARKADPGLRQTPLITTPTDVLRRQDRERRKPLVRLIAVCIIIFSVLFIPAALIPKLDIVTLVAITLALVGGLASYVLNQMGHVIGAGFVLLLGSALAIGWEIVGSAQVQHGIDISDLRLFDLFTILIVLSGVLIGRNGPIVIGAATTGFTLLALVLLPHTQPLQEYWNGTYPFAIRGSYYDVIAVALAIQILTTGIIWLGSNSVQYALRDASRADDLQAANEQIQKQARSLALQRARLQEGIAQIQQVHTAVAHGQWDARATAAHGELLPVAISLNLLLDRLGRLTREQETRARVDSAAHELALALQQVRQGFPYVPPAYTGTPLDEVLVELAHLRTMRLPVNSQSRLAESELMKSYPEDSQPRYPSGLLRLGMSEVSSSSPSSRGLFSAPSEPLEASPRTSPVSPEPDTSLDNTGGQPMWQAPDLLDKELELPSWLYTQAEQSMEPLE